MHFKYVLVVLYLGVTAAILFPTTGYPEESGNKESTTHSDQTAGKLLTTRSGKVYHDYDILRKNAREITIRHKAGVSRILISDLPADLQRALEYSPTDDARLARQRVDQYQRQKAIEEKRRQRMDVSLEIVQVMPNAFLGKGGQEKTKVVRQVRPKYGQPNRFTGRKQFLGNDVTYQKQNYRADFSDVVVVYGTNAKNLLNSRIGYWTGSVYPAGTCTYDSVGAGKKTVLLFAADPITALKIEQGEISPKLFTE